MIQISFNSSDKRVAEALARRGPAVVERVADRLEGLMLELQRRVQQKLSGEVLQHRSGKALGSVIKEPIEKSGTKIVGMVKAGGGPAWYLIVQEKGGTRQYEIKPVNKKALAFFPGGSVGGAISSGTGSFLPGKSTVRGLYARSGRAGGSLKPGRLETFGRLGGIVVQKVIHPPLPVRSFMRTSLEELQGKIIEGVRQAAVQGLRGE